MFTIGVQLPCGAVSAAKSKRMKFVLRLVLSVPLMAVVAFCLFGFMATFEPMPRVPQLVWRGVHALAGSAAFVTICWMWLRPRGRCNSNIQ
jgi:hypothetical protein